ncbi:MAG: ABC transporter permease [Litoricola sp.]|jgi:putative hydroxymethylpyrimidine transport system permease protein|nr:ABC transporter permease [Litorivicinus sp.]
MSRVLAILAPMTLLITVWWSTVIIFDIPHFILPSPDRVARVLFNRLGLISVHAATTALEIICGLLLGSFLGFTVACLIGDSKRLQSITMPALIISQALPVFAIAPILMLWLGYGFASKLAMTTLIVFFPVTASTLSGFRALPSSWETTFQTLRPRQSKLFFLVRLPLAIPYALAGVRVAASVAPIGAIVGEWVGSSSGLGYLMLHANGRGQTDLMFAALVVLCAESLIIWSITNRISHRFDQKYADAI